MTEKEFMTEFNGHANAYSSYMVIDVELSELLKTLNNINPDMCVGSGVVSKRGISFEICKELPDLIYQITKELNCKGFADIGGWYGAGYFLAAKDGEDYDDFSAYWTDGNPERRDWEYPEPENISDEDVDWDVFLFVKDNGSGEIFYTGEGAVDYESMKMWKELVDSH